MEFQEWNCWLSCDSSNFSFFFLRNLHIMFSTVAAQIYIPTNSVRVPKRPLDISEALRLKDVLEMGVGIKCIHLRK